MDTIRVVWGSATGPTRLSSFDAALAEAGVHNYNLVGVSSVVPGGAPVEGVGTAGDLGGVGGALYCVESCETLGPGAEGPAVAALGWARDDEGRGLFYEASGSDPDAARTTVERGLTHGMTLRGWTVTDREVVVETAATDPDAHVTAVAVAAYGRAESLLER